MAILCIIVTVVVYTVISCLPSMLRKHSPIDGWLSCYVTRQVVSTFRTLVSTNLGSIPGQNQSINVPVFYQKVTMGFYLVMLMCFIREYQDWASVEQHDIRTKVLNKGNTYLSSVRSIS